MLPRITFGMIVLNGQPLLLYNLRSVYPFASQIVVIEGASPKAAHASTSDGHSIDGTLEARPAFKANEDPRNIVTIVTAEDEGHPDGFWPGDKDEQSSAYSLRATGDWLWQLDVDEFYRHDDMRRVCDYLRTHPQTTCVSFSIHQYWGGFDFLVDGGLFLSHNYAGEPWGAARRIFRWGPGSKYTTHRPPTVTTSAGEVITERVLNITKKLRPHCYLFHYSMIFRHQFMQKGRYYDNHNWKHEDDVETRYRRLYATIDGRDVFSIYTHMGTHNWLLRNRFEHPYEISRLQEDLKTDPLNYELRSTSDIEAIVSSHLYNIRIAWLYLEEWMYAASGLAWYKIKVQLKRYAMTRTLAYSIKSRFQGKV